MACLVLQSGHVTTMYHLNRLQADNKIGEGGQNFVGASITARSLFGLALSMLNVLMRSVSSGGVVH